MEAFRTILLSVFLGSIGQVVLKMGSNKAGKLTLSAKTISNDLAKLLIIPELYLGVMLFGVSFLLWIKVLGSSEVSKVYPLVSLGYIIVMLLSAFLFHEQVTPTKFLGTAIIITGVFVLNS